MIQLSNREPLSFFELLVTSEAWLWLWHDGHCCAYECCLLWPFASLPGVWKE